MCWAICLALIYSGLFALIGANSWLLYDTSLHGQPDGVAIIIIVVSVIIIGLISYTIWPLIVLKNPFLLKWPTFMTDSPN